MGSFCPCRSRYISLLSAFSYYIVDRFMHVWHVHHALFNYHLQWTHARPREFTIYFVPSESSLFCFFFFLFFLLFNARPANDSICWMNWTFDKYTGTFHFTIFTHSMQRAWQYGHYVNTLTTQLWMKNKLNGRPRITRWLLLLWFLLLLCIRQRQYRRRSLFYFYSFLLIFF